MPYKVTVKVRTEQHLTSPEVFQSALEGNIRTLHLDGVQNGDEPPIQVMSDTPGDDAAEDYETDNASQTLITEGVLRVGRRRAVLSYCEAGGTEIVYSFGRDEPELLMLTRRDSSADNGYRDAVEITMIFEAGRRHINVCRRDGEYFEVITRASLLENELLTRGRLRLSYTVEIHGAVAESTRLSIRLQRMKTGE